MKTSKKIKVAVCGLGWWGSKVLRNCVRHPGIFETVGCDPDPVLRADMERQFGVATFDGLEAAIASTTLDAVFVITPPATHHATVKTALERDLHVVVAKPPTLTVPELAELIALARARQRVFMTDATFCYSPPCREIRAILGRGELGVVRYVESVRYGDNLRVQGYARLANAGLLTRTDVIRDLVLHDLALLLLIFGHEFRLDFVSRAANIFPNLCETAHLHFSTPQLQAHVGLSWTMPERTRRFTLHGEKAILVWDDLAPDRRLWSLDTQGAKEVVYALEPTEPLYAMIDHFLACLATGNEADTGPTLMLHAMQLVQNIEEFPHE